MASHFETDEDLRKMREFFIKKPDFTERYSRGMKYYQSGAWKRANEEFSYVAKILKRKD